MPPFNPGQGSTQWFEFVGSNNGAAPSAISATGVVFQDRWPSLTISDLRASLVVASTTTNFTIDLLVNGVSILSTPLTILANQKTSLVVGTPAFVITNRIVPDDAEMTLSLLAVGANAAGLTVRALISR